jgi:transcriptional antiterminator RfaH
MWCWYLVQTKKKCERRVAVEWHQRGLEVYLPLVWGSPVNPRAARERPFFPGHLFARLDLEAVAAAVVRWSPGIRGLVEFNGEPAPLSDAFVAGLRRRLEGIRAVGAMGQDGSRAADFVPMSRSPFDGYEGLFNPALLGAERTRILLACVQQEHFRQALQARLGRRQPGEAAGRDPLD